MKKFKERCGTTLPEILISIALLGLLIVPISSGILTSMRINEKSDDMMRARLAVSSAAETIMAVGIDSADTLRNLNLPDVVIDNGITAQDGYWTLTVRSDKFSEVFVEIRVRSNAVRTSENGGGGP